MLRINRNFAGFDGFKLKLLIHAVPQLKSDCETGQVFRQ
jgi:hypothetical protein